MKRLLDLVIAVLAACIFAIPLLLIALFVHFTSRGPILYWSVRIGRGGHTYEMPKFRSMRIDTPQVATHLLVNPDEWLTPIGAFLRKSSLDEIPQLWSILRGDMSFVGPRPALFNQIDLIELRKSAGIDVLLPGLTGWAQINGRDELSTLEKVKLDEEYLKNYSTFFDLKIILLTFIKVLSGDDISH